MCVCARACMHVLEWSWKWLCASVLIHPSSVTSEWSSCSFDLKGSLSPPPPTAGFPSLTTRGTLNCGAEGVCVLRDAPCHCSRPVIGGRQCLVRGRSLTRAACVWGTWTTVAQDMVSVLQCHYWDFNQQLNAHISYSLFQWHIMNEWVIKLYLQWGIHEHFK